MYEYNTQKCTVKLSLIVMQKCQDILSKLCTLLIIKVWQCMNLNDTQMYCNNNETVCICVFKWVCSDLIEHWAQFHWTEAESSFQSSQNNWVISKY